MIHRAYVLERSLPGLRTDRTQDSREEPGLSGLETGFRSKPGEASGMAWGHVTAPQVPPL